MNYTLTNPCDKCPFRKDIPAFLTPGRVRDLENALIGAQGTFTCHQTTVAAEPSEDDGDEFDNMVDGPNAQHCAGALIMLEKMERPNQMMRICERIGLYDRRKLNMGAPVFDDFEEMEDAQRARSKPVKKSKKTSKRP